jgi:hypothetical protein
LFLHKIFFSISFLRQPSTLILAVDQPLSLSTWRPLHPKGTSTEEDSTDDEKSTASWADIFSAGPTPDLDWNNASKTTNASKTSSALPRVSNASTEPITGQSAPSLSQEVDLTAYSPPETVQPNETTVVSSSQEEIVLDGTPDREASNVASASKFGLPSQPKMSFEMEDRLIGRHNQSLGDKGTKVWIFRMKMKAWKTKKRWAPVS